MTEEEKKAEIEQMTQLFDTLAREIAIFATDKIEDMSEIKRFYKNLAPEYDHLTSDIIAAIESTESRNSAAVQRAFYFIIRTDKQEESVYNQIAGKGYHINKAQREELAVLLRNYYLREFISAEIYTLEKELKQDVKLRKKIEKKPETVSERATAEITSAQHGIFSVFCSTERDVPIHDDAQKFSL